MSETAFRYTVASGFPTGRPKQRFEPTNKQLETAMYRITCILRNHEGAIEVNSRKHAINFLHKRIHSRGGELGTNRHEVGQTVQAAYRLLIVKQLVLFDKEQGLVDLTLKGEALARSKSSRQPNQTYSRKRHGRRASRVRVA